MGKEQIFDVAQLAHVEILTPDPDKTLWFFKELLGMSETKREGQSVYLRAYEDFYHHSLKVTEGKQAGLGHVGWRASSKPALERRVEALMKSGYGKGWIDGDYGHGDAYQFITPDGHNMEILWDVEYYQAPEGQTTKLKNRPQKRPLNGVPVRRLDHVNLLANDPTSNKQFMMDELGFRLREHLVNKDGTDGAAWLSVSPLVHELAFLGDAMGGKGRLHHVCYWYGYPQHLNDLSDLCVENGIQIEAGPGKHGISQANFLYVIEPGGNRVELFGDAGYLIFDPDWKPVAWTEEEVEKAIIWYGAPLPAEYFRYGTPQIKEPAILG
ncbi:catechol 2,3-dioxygenase [Oceanobacillus sp. 143]|uniref:Metapyrocatechase n=1 Tax=Oceanobacillus zhaokaii TaxID=2052660 RepID=A0A345PLI4_9BACI|nr:catechol 2,3-dioxygenase [Oceanobacillus zhaokaii]AXI10864.1 catechol 2,3-dioxygenase [Oceanobacillus zhaokaii]QGS69733.1 catechol 2,3-dioxygenase [Oceanobacillus sp. 143]